MGTHREVIKLSIKQEFFEQFGRQQARAGDALSVAWLYDDFLPTLSKKELVALEEILAEMVNEGIIEHVREKRSTYRLTSKGATLL